MILNSRVAKWILVGLALLPVVLYIYLGHFSRMTTDDFLNISRAMESGPWQNMLYWRGLWTGHYSTPFLFGLLAPLDAALPAVLIVLSVLIWTLALAWLISQFLSLLNVKRYKLEIAVSLAALSVAASISAFYSRPSFFWLIAHIQYTLPVSLLTAILAYWLATARHSRSFAALTLSAVGSALVTFICAGFSEMYLVFQLTFISLLLVLLTSIREIRWKALALVGGGWLGTLLSLAVQWSSPGRLLRTEAIWHYQQFRPMRHLPDIVNLGLRDLYHMAVNPDTLVSFLLLFAVAMLVSVGYKVTSPPAMITGLRWFSDSRAPYYAALIVQFIFVPVLWSHTSDDLRFFGRFSFGFLLVVALNSALIVLLFLAIWRLRRLRAHLKEEPRTLAAYILVLALAGLVLLTLPQLHAMHIFAFNHIFATALSLLLVAWWEWTISIADPVQRQFRLLALASTVIALLSVAALISVPRFFVGVGAPRHWSAAAFVLVSLGLIWGAVIGQSLGTLGRNAQAQIRLACAAVVCITYVLIVIGQIRLIPDFERFASEWDDRHALLLDLKDSGQTHIEIPPRAFDLDSFLLQGILAADEGYPDPFNNVLQGYYGYESVTVTVDS